MMSYGIMSSKKTFRKVSPRYSVIGYSLYRFLQENPIEISYDDLTIPPKNKNSLKNQYPKPYNAYYPSEALDCRRKLFYKRILTINDLYEADDPKIAFGVLFHEIAENAIKHYIDNNIWDVKTEVFVMKYYPHIVITGMADVVVELKDNALITYKKRYGQIIVGELKTAWNMYKIKKRPRKKDLAQIQICMDAFKAPRGELIYINAYSALQNKKLCEENDLVVYEVFNDKSLRREVIKDFLIVYDHIISKWQLPRVSIIKTRPYRLFRGLNREWRSWQCQYCPFYDFCIEKYLPNRSDVELISHDFFKL